VGWIIAILGIGAIWFFWPILKTKIFPDVPPVPKWKPQIPPNISRIVAALSYYSDYKNSFAVFSNGTCVILDTNSGNFEKAAKETLDKVYKSQPDFETLPMKDGNWLVRYHEAVVSVVFEDEIKAHWEEIENNYSNGLTPHEMLIDKSGTIKEINRDAKIGLFARSRMFMDAQNPQVVNVLGVVPTKNSIYQDFPKSGHFYP
jgi:hypothetical protein